MCGGYNNTGTGFSPSTPFCSPLSAVIPSMVHIASLSLSWKIDPLYEH